MQTQMNNVVDAIASLSDPTNDPVPNLENDV
jgi:hypothetical protein